MKASEIKKYRKAMEKTLEPKRFEHTLGVAYTAATLAMVHGEDVDKALLAGMLHDCAKCMSHQKQLALCEKEHIVLTQIEREHNSPLIHAKVGSLLAKKKYGVKDKDILNAICYHTTGRPDMSRLEKIIYIADYIEPSRSAGHKAVDESAREYAKNLAIVRKLAYQDLDRALCQILGDTLAYLEKKGGQINQLSQITYDYYAKESEKSDGK